MFKVSVVVPFYNRSYFFKRLLDGIENQTQKVDMVFVVDNGSDIDEIKKISKIIAASKLDVTLVSTLKRGNANYARNLGYLLSDTKYVAFLDSDDWWEPQHLFLSCKKLHQSDKVGVYSGCNVLGSSSLINKSEDIDKLKCPFELLFSKCGYLAQTSSFVVNKAILNDDVMWDDSLHRHQDYDYFLSIHFNTIGWCYANQITVNLDWDQGGTVNPSMQSKIDFFEKWKDKFPLHLKSYYLYTQIVLCKKHSVYIDFYDYYKKQYVECLNNSTISKLKSSNIFVWIRILILNFLVRHNLKNKVRSLVRKKIRH